MVGGIVWFISQLGFYLCLFAGLGALPYEVFSLLAFWPLAIFSLIFPDVSFDWPMPCIISLIGWLLLTIIAASLFHILTSCRKQKIRDERPVA
jgi:hypothetical protein